MLELANLTTETLTKLKTEIETELANRDSNKILVRDDITKIYFYADSIDAVYRKLCELCADYMMLGVLHLDEYIIKLNPKYNPPEYYSSMGWSLESGRVIFDPSVEPIGELHGVQTYLIRVESPIVIQV